mmetsp:Transcript_34972/g.54838  ORF Transcript_34972/g.54838 Transcript_34972/m.54838 type:complete len:332 (+) Transcript_34972:83-1078(+)
MTMLHVSRIGRSSQVSIWIIIMVAMMVGTSLAFSSLGSVGGPIISSSVQSRFRYDSAIKAGNDGDGELDYPGYIQRQIELKKRPPTVKFPRKRLVLDFAVILMRSSYAVTDELDFVPMDEFQRSFFLYRQFEYEEYLRQTPGVLQGDLADPKYFDFISFAQYHTISEKMKTPRQVFVEKCGAEGEEEVVRRDPTVGDAQLPALHRARVGKRILEFLGNQYPSAMPVPEAGLSPEALLRSVVQLMGLFRLNFYMLNYKVNAMEKDKFEVVLEVPCNLWSQQVLKQQNTLVTNNFEVKAILAFLNSCGLDASYSTKYRETEISHTFQVKRLLS